MSLTIVELIPVSFLFGGIVKLCFHGGMSMLSQEAYCLRRRALAHQQSQYHLPRTTPKPVEPDKERPVLYSKPATSKVV